MSTSDTSKSSSSLPKKGTSDNRSEEDRHLMAGKKLEKKCGNPECYARAREVELRNCARCKSMRYCSRECQVAHWKSHKTSCNNNMELAEALAKADARGALRGLLPPGLTLLELDQKLEKWVKFYSNLLMAATIHALSLPKDIKRARSYLLRVKVVYQPDNNGVIAKAFRVYDASVISVEEGRALGGVWPASIDQLQQLREEGEALRRGTSAAVALECEPLAMQTVPFGSLRDLSRLKIQHRWKEILIKNVEAGKKYTHFEIDD